MLVRGNDKVGKDVWIVDIPAVKTCPGSTPTCRSVCYANKSRYKTGLVQKRLAATLRASKKESFADVVVSLIDSVDAKTVRIHASGDFVTAAYAGKWLAVIKACPDTKFYAYTRSWRIPEINAVLREMAGQPNMSLWYSCDKDTGVPTKRETPPRVRLAWLAVDDGERPPRADLVFRAHKLRRAPKGQFQDRYRRDVKVCPTETGMPGAKDVTCGTCRYCLVIPHEQNRPLSSIKRAAGAVSTARIELPMLRV